MGDLLPSVHRFLQSIDKEDYKVLEELARQRKMTVQKFLRYHVFPEWLKMASTREKHRKLAKIELAALKKGKHDWAF